MKEKKKLSLAMQIFIALVLAIIVGLLLQGHSNIAHNGKQHHRHYNELYQVQENCSKGLNIIFRNITMSL